MLTLSSPLYSHLRGEGKLRSKFTEEKTPGCTVSTTPIRHSCFKRTHWRNPSLHQLYMYFHLPQQLACSREEITSNLQSRSIGKDSEAGKAWGQEEKGGKEDEVVGWHLWPNRHEFEQALGDGEGQGSLVCCSPWGHRVGHDLATKQQTTTAGKGHLPKSFLWGSECDLTMGLVLLLGQLLGVS